jgi:hypothetical protein
VTTRRDRSHDPVDDAHRGAAGRDYEIVVRGGLSGPITRAFAELEVRPSRSGVTCFHGRVPDPTALQSIMARFGELAIELISVRQLAEGDRVGTGRSPEPGDPPGDRRR